MPVQQTYRFDPAVHDALVLLPWRCWCCNSDVPPGPVYYATYRGRESSWCEPCEMRRRKALAEAYRRVTLDPHVGGKADLLAADDALVDCRGPFQNPIGPKPRMLTRDPVPAVTTTPPAWTTYPTGGETSETAGRPPEAAPRTQLGERSP